MVSKSKNVSWDYLGIEILTNVDVVLLRGRNKQKKEFGWILETKEAKQLRKDLELLG